MSNQLASGDIKSLLNIIQTHQKGVGGGSDSSSASMKTPTNTSNAFMNWLNSAITSGVNTVGKAIGNTKVINYSPNSPTIKDILNYVNAPSKEGVSVGLPGSTFLNGGMKNSSDVAMAALGVGSILEGGAENPEADVNDEEAAAGGLPKGTIPDASGNPIVKPKLNTTSQFVKDENGGVVENKNYQPPAASNAQYANDNQATAPLNPNAEKFPLDQSEVPPTNPAGQVVDPATADQARARTYSPADEPSTNLITNVKRNLQYTDDIPSPKVKAQVNATLNGYGITGSMDQQLQGIEDQKGILSKAAQTQVAQDGGTTAKADLLAGMTHDVAYNGSSHNIPSTEVRGQSLKYINNVYVRATGGDPTKLTGDIMPDQVPDTVVQKMKSLMGQDAAKTFGKDPSTWTTSQQIARYGRNSFDTLLDKNHLEASILNNDMSDLYKAQDSIMNGANKESTAAQSAAMQPKSNLALNFLKGSVSSIPHAAATASILGGAGVLGYGAFANASIPKNYKFGTGNVTVPGPGDIITQTGNSLQSDVANYTKGIQDINQQEMPLKVQLQSYDPNVVREAQGKYDALELQRNTINTNFSTIKPLYDQYTETSNVVQGLDSAQKSIKAANPFFLQAYGSLGGILTGVRSAIDPNYSRFVQTLNNLHQLYGVDVSNIINSGSRESADSAISATVKNYMDKLQNTVNTSGGKYPTSQATGKDLINNLLQNAHTTTNVNTSSPALNAVLNPPSPTPTAGPAPTLDPFQQQLQAPFQPGVMPGM